MFVFVFVFGYHFRFVFVFVTAKVRAALVGVGEVRAWIRCCRSCWADRRSTNRRAWAVSGAQMVVGGEPIRFVGGGGGGVDLEGSFALIERIKLYGCLLV